MFSPTTRFYQASTSEMFGNNYSEKMHVYGNLDNKKYQDESTPFSPQSPYGVSKLAAHELVRIYRDSYNLFACCGILFNHESERRGENFVTRKITKWIGEFVKWQDGCEFVGCGIKLPEDHDFVRSIGKPANKPEFPKLRLGNLDSYRDWGHAEDYVEAMYLMLQQDKPDDFVISTGETHSVRDFLKEAFNEINIEDFESYVIIDPKFYRACEVNYLCGDSTKARKVLGWKPKTSFKELVKRMVWGDINGKEEKVQQSTQQEEKLS